ncbi:MAG: hypothetical protein KKE02_00315 [Alphaproteobacteria bacterium]|nr:hypothetical protein [Alphaproteobacteria bacterium]MBU1514889.1 hypothetical protein [Alphaproteobacteria bacterium]MBU2093810.1 hypothetical protein [Alphaproteobacteria bacterium]MBU2149431.1 hypothetical protein [Alphaproteobacteria bacterium]MBU2305391.1 hypothetical protein [Alphaproteobacteria bacterium]
MTPFINTVRPREARPAYRCPCCYFTTLHGRGDYDVCPVCSWEDDGQDDHDADEVRGGPNSDVSLTEARANFRRMGAFIAEAAPYVRAATDEERKPPLP